MKNRLVFLLALSVLCGLVQAVTAGPVVGYTEQVPPYNVGFWTVGSVIGAVAILTIVVSLILPVFISDQARKRGFFGCIAGLSAILTIICFFVVSAESKLHNGYVLAPVHRGIIPDGCYLRVDASVNSKGFLIQARSSNPADGVKVAFVTRKKSDTYVIKHGELLASSGP